MVVTPVGKLAGALLVILATVQLSLVMGSTKTIVVASHESLSDEALMLEGAVIVGAVVSETVTS